MTTVVQLGADVASVDGLGEHPTWPAAVLTGRMRFAILRATYGTVPDSKFKQYTAQLEGIGVPTSAYGYLRFGANMPAPESQAEALLQMVGPPNQKRLPPALDVEGSRGGFTPAQELDWVIRAARTIRKGIGAWPMIYTSRVYWTDPEGLNDLAAPELVECAGWWKQWPFAEKKPAEYNPVDIGALHAPACPSPWGTQWLIHQYQGDALAYPGLINTCDLNRVHVVQQGDANDTVAWIQRRAGGLTPDGKFGPKTAARIAEVQGAHGLTRDSIVGLATHSVLCWLNQTAA